VPPDLPQHPIGLALTSGGAAGRRYGEQRLGAGSGETDANYDRAIEHESVDAGVAPLSFGPFRGAGGLSGISLPSRPNKSR
jgi:hypothetical protein